MLKDENDGSSDFEDFVAEINRPHRRLGVSGEEFYRKPRYKIIRPPNTTPKPVRQALSCSVVGGLVLLVFLTLRAYLRTRNDEILAVLILASVSLVVLFFASRDNKSFDMPDEEKNEGE